MNNKYRLLLIGDGVNKPVIHDMVHKLNLSHAVTLQATLQKYLN